MYVIPVPQPSWLCLKENLEILRRKWIKENVVLGEIEGINILKISVYWCIIPVNDLQWETCCFQRDNLYRGLMEKYTTWCNNNHLKFNINKMFCPNSKKFTLCNPEISHTQEWDGWMWGHSDFDFWPVITKSPNLKTFFQCIPEILSSWEWERP